MKTFLGKLGINEDTLTAVDTWVSDRILVMDGDASCYEAATTVAKLDTALRRVEEKIITAMYLTQSPAARVHITPEGSYKAGRHLYVGAQPYQANRDPNAKPTLLAPIRKALKGYIESKYPEITVIENFTLEADDGIIIDSCKLKQDVVVWSPDKDLRVTPASYYEISTGIIDTIPNRFGYITIGSTETGNNKPKGHGTKFFWWQMLMGDTADNIKGLRSYKGKSIGAVRAYNLIKDITDEQECANFVLECYKSINQNPLPEGSLLWLLRDEHDSFVNYLKEFNFNQEIKEFLHDCYRRKWKEDPRRLCSEDNQVDAS